MAKAKRDLKAPRRKWKLRRWFLKHGGKKTDIPKGFRWRTPKVGQPARELIKMVQRMAKLDHISGQFDADTRRLLFPPSFGQTAVSVAMAEVGVKEQPANSNDGPRVRVYQATTGAYKAPWCASGARWVYGEAARRRGRTIKWFPNPAWVPNWTAAAGGKAFKRIPFLLAKPGDYVTLWQSGHIEIVVKRDGDSLICIGFNTSPVGQNANGGMVALTRRHKSEVTRIGRLR